MVSLLTTGITCTTRISSSSHRFTPTALHLPLLLQWIYCSNQVTFRQFKDDPDAIQASQGRLALVESGALFRASSELGTEVRATKKRNRQVAHNEKVRQNKTWLTALIHSSNTTLWYKVKPKQYTHILSAVKSHWSPLLTCVYTGVSWN